MKCVKSDFSLDKHISAGVKCAQRAQMESEVRLRSSGNGWLPTTRRTTAETRLLDSYGTLPRTLVRNVSSVIH